jgi:hypothetical protein
MTGLAISSGSGGQCLSRYVCACVLGRVGSSWAVCACVFSSSGVSGRSLMAAGAAICTICLAGVPVWELFTGCWHNLCCILDNPVYGEYSAAFVAGSVPLLYSGSGRHSRKTVEGWGWALSCCVCGMIYNAIYYYLSTRCPLPIIYLLSLWTAVA